MGEEDMAVAAIGNGCCGDSAWRGHLCQYHEGYRAAQDVYEAEIADLRQTIRELTDLGWGA